MLRRLNSLATALTIASTLFVSWTIICGVIWWVPLPSTASLRPPSRRDKQKCQDYGGCPVYPSEYDEPLVSEAVQAQAKDSNHIVPFGTQSRAMVTRQSNEHLFNQDNAFMIEPFWTKQTPKDTKSFLIGIVDGHGDKGHVVAHYAALAIPRVLSERLNARPCCQSDEWIKQQLNETFIQVDIEAPPDAMRGGCTASVTLRIGSKLYFANAGDSRTILVNYNADEENFNVPYMTREDKPHLEDERARIEGLGGQIHIPPQNPAWSRVVVYSSAAIPPEPIGLAMSRSIGDWEWKVIGVIAEPIVDVVNVSNYAAAYVLAASDGVWDTRKPQFLAKRLGRAFFPMDNPKRSPLKECVDTILQVSPQEENWYRDDMTVIIIRI